MTKVLKAIEKAMSKENGNRKTSNVDPKKFDSKVTHRDPEPTLNPND